MSALIAKVLFPVNIAEPFDYSVPPGMAPKRGDIVFAPLGSQMKLGVIWDIGQGEQRQGLKDVAQIKATLPLPVETLKFVDWTANYSVASKGMVLRMVLRSIKALDPSLEAVFYHPTPLTPAKLTNARARVLEADINYPARLSEITSHTGVSPSVVKGLEKIGALETVLQPVDAPFDVPNPDKVAPVTLTPAQSDVAAGLIKEVAERKFSVALIDGVTGSGKTEVYFEAVAEALRQGGQALILVPEIALTQASLKRFHARFDASPAAWHSALGDSERRRAWREISQGRAKLVVGARSALYLPFKDLRLIVVDEEHDSSYKQEEGVIYNARDMSVVRGMIGQHAIILASATPSLESLHNARRGRYNHYILPERPGSVTLPDIDLVDLKDNKPAKGDYISEPLIQAVNEVLKNKEQALLYLNRRGYAPHVMCNVCGERLKSPDTDSWLVEHRRTGRAMCHHTGFSMKMPTACLKCGSVDSLVGVGPGVERIAEEAHRHFPHARIEVLSSDTKGKPEDIRERMARMETGEIDILVGTQMVVKGHNFPLLTFVGVVDGDLSLAGGDLRAGERTYQTLVQVAGRAGRADKHGRALIQTHQPDHEALAALALGDRDLFIETELAMRDMLELPPFGKLAAVIISGPDKRQVEALSRAFLQQAPRSKHVDISGPSEAPIGLLRGRFRMRLLVQAAPELNLSSYLQDWRERIKLKPKYKIQVDIDPQSFM